MEKYKGVLVICTIIGLPLIYFSENIYGYYQFQYYCHKDYGFKVNDNLEKSVGWRAKNYLEASFISKVKNVGFVRYFDDGKEYDLVYVSGNRNSQRSYLRKEASKDLVVKYVWMSEGSNIKNNKRINKSSYLIRDVFSSEILISFTNYSYSFFNRDKTLLGASSLTYCSEGGFNLIDKINNSFN